MIGGDRDWYQRHLGFELEFEIQERKTAAMRDDVDRCSFTKEKWPRASVFGSRSKWTMSRPSTLRSSQPGCPLSIRR
jgi:hypothetical protein